MHGAWAWGAEALGSGGVRWHEHVGWVRTHGHAVLGVPRCQVRGSGDMVRMGLILLGAVGLRPRGGPVPWGGEQLTVRGLWVDPPRMCGAIG